MTVTWAMLVGGVAAVVCQLFCPSEKGQKKGEGASITFGFWSEKVVTLRLTCVRAPGKR